MAWQMKARYYEACNCALGCSCNMSGFPSNGFCEGAICFQVLEGEKDGVDLSGAKVASAAQWPGAIHEGNGKLAVFIDAKEEQRGPLVSILTAEDPGLPFEIIAATMTEVHGPFFETVELSGDRGDSLIKVGDKFHVQMTSFKDPIAGEKHEPHMVLPNGFIFQDGVIGTTSVNQLDVDGMKFDHAGNNAYYAEVEWSSENRMAPAVG